MGKSFEKQTKRIEDQTKIIKDKKEQTKKAEKQLDKYDDDIKKGNLSVDKQREIFNGINKERRKTMYELHIAAEFNNLLYHYKSPTKDEDFSMYNDAKSLFDMIRNKDISLTHAEKNKADLESDLTDIKIDTRKSSAQNKVTKNFQVFRDSQQAVINIYKDYSSLAINAAYDAKQ